MDLLRSCMPISDALVILIVGAWPAIVVERVLTVASSLVPIRLWYISWERDYVALHQDPG